VNPTTAIDCTTSSTRSVGTPGAPDRAQDRGVLAEPLEHQDRHHPEEREPDRIGDDDGHGPGSEQRVPGDEARAGRQPARLVVVGDRATHVDEREDDRESDDEGRGIDQQHTRRTEEADQGAAERRAEDHRQPVRALQESVRLGQRALVLADELRHQTLFRSNRRCREGTDRRDEDEQDGKRERVCEVQDRNQRDQWSTHAVRDQHGAARPESRDDVAAQEADDPERRSLDSEHERHPRGRARRGQHEPRDRDPGHLRPGDRDDVA
jgi:hypothetical protein